MFDFNTGEGNEGDAWMPGSDQVSMFRGAENYRDECFLGFFAGITVETSNVIIDVNSKALRQSIEFYYQQRWFSIIELDSQSFSLDKDLECLVHHHQLQKM